MRFLATCVLLGLLAPLARGQDDGITGSWKVVLLQDGQQINFWLLKIENKDSKITGNGEPMMEQLPPATVKGKIDGDVLLLTMALNKTVKAEFEGKLPKVGAKKIYGSTLLQGKLIPTVLEATTAKNKLELNKEIILRTPSDPRVFTSALTLLADAKASKVPAKDVAEWTEAVLRSAENYGPRWQLDYSLKLIESLAKNPEYAPIALEAASRLEKSLDAKTPPLTQINILSVMVNVLKSAGKAEEAKVLEGKLETLETKAHAEYEKSALNFEIKKFGGRKSKSMRSVLVELFTGAQCPPCVAADMAFDGLERTFSPKEVVLLQYHLHIPRPDALANGDTEARAKYYEKFLEGTPTMFFNGKPLDESGGFKQHAPQRYDDFCEIVEKLMEAETTVHLSTTAIQKGDKIAIEAKVDGVANPGEKIRLRFALVEDWARYKGSNGLTYHHRIVRDMPGGPKGFAVAKASETQSVSVDVSELRANLAKYLDESAKEAPFADDQRPLRLREFHVVAFVQDDATYEVLQAAEVKVKVE